MKKITKDMLIGDAVQENPKAAEVMFEHGLHCVGCCGAAMESIEDGAKGHGMPDEEIEEMLKEINAEEKEEVSEEDSEDTDESNE
ncbi:MAG: DUF1858 domain-containing protein [Candidatus Woesearchaeota archaeon]